jgi:predicted aconitase with swiveling domain
MELARGRILVAGAAEGRVLRLAEPLSFWGGVDPVTGVLIDPRGPSPGAAIAGRVLVLAATRGSSSSSAILLELLRAGRAPAALVLAEVDAILIIGVLVAREMGWPTIPVLELPLAGQTALADGSEVRVTADGAILAAGRGPC